jgi:hypothetical protein
MATRTFISKSGDTWEWEETPETIEAFKQLHNSIVNSKLVKPNKIQNDIQTTN